MISRNPEVEHGAIVHIRCEIHEKLKTGEFSGSPVVVEKRSLVIKGTNLLDAQKRLNEALDEIAKFAEK